MTALTTSSVDLPDRPPVETAPRDLRRERAQAVARALATHWILPPPTEAAPQGEALRQLLADLARAERSEHADVLREVSEERGVGIDELARRAQFMLACLLLPASGTYYEVLGVPPRASAREIRRRWAAAIHRYHPDRFGGRNAWLDAQARRLIEAYETLRDPERRRRYDAELGRAGLPDRLAGPPASGRVRWPSRGRPGPWMPAIAAVAAALFGLAVVAFSRLGPPPLPPAALPPAPKLLDKWLAPPPPASTANQPTASQARGIEPPPSGGAPAP